MSTPTTSPTKDRPKDRPNFAVPKPTCPNCNDEFDKTESRPKILPCGHSICLSCLLRMTQPKLYKGLSRCPICHEVVDLPPGGYADLKDNIVVTDLLRTIKPAKCVSHAPEAYISLCMTCHRPLCTTCQREAMVGNVHRGHEIVTYDKGMMSLRNNLHHEIEGTEQLYREKIVDPNTSLQATYKADSEKKSAIIDQLVTDAIEQIKHWGDGMKSRLAEKSEQDLKTLELSKSDFEAKIASLSSESFACIESQDKILNKEQYSKIKSDHKILSKEMEKSKLPKLHTLNITSEKGIAVKFPKFEDCKFNAQ